MISRAGNGITTAKSCTNVQLIADEKWYMLWGLRYAALFFVDKSLIENSIENFPFRNETRIIFSGGVERSLCVSLSRCVKLRPKSERWSPFRSLVRIRSQARYCDAARDYRGVDEIITTRVCRDQVGEWARNITRVGGRSSQGWSVRRR